MAIVIFAQEFFSQPANLLPVPFVVAAASVGLLLLSRRRRIQKPTRLSLIATVMAVAALFGALLALNLGFGVAAEKIFGEFLFWVGLGMTAAISWPFVWIVEQMLFRRQRLSNLRDTSAFE